MNVVILSGRLGQDPDVRYTKTGKAVASFSLAVNKQGNNDSVDFVPIVAWQSLAEMAGNNLSKGSEVLVQGRLQIRSYEANDGQKKRVAEVVAELISPNFSKAEKAKQKAEQKEPDAANQFGSDVLPDSEIPF